MIESVQTYKMQLVRILIAAFLLLLSSCSSVFGSEDFTLLEGLIRKLIFPRQLQPSYFSHHQSAENYRLSEWSAYTSCTKICGGGSHSRTRNCLDSNGNQVLMKYCKTLPSSSMMRPINSIDALRRYLTGNDHLQETDTSRCNEQRCRTTEWSDWSKCSRPCGNGQQYSSRECMDTANQTLCQFTNIRIQYCNQIPCFRTTSWSEYSNCSRECGGGFRTRVRTCEPNIAKNESQYERLQSIITKMDYSQFGSLSLFISEEGIDYHDAIEYMKSCRTNRKETSLCSLRSCPECKNNQVYHTCKPCVRQCYRTDLFNYFRDLSYSGSTFFSQVVEQLTGCNEVCESGCGCPPLEPYLGGDGVCYRLPFECPINRGRVIILPETESPAFMTTQLPVVSSTPKQVEPEVIETTSPTPEVTPPTTTSITGSRIVTTTEEQEEAPERDDSLPECLPDVMIATRPGFIPCNCKGTLEPTQCYMSEGTSCPVICRDNKRGLKCPGEEMVAILKSFGRDCSHYSTTPSCVQDEDCGDRRICCKTRCGFRCLSGLREV